MDDEDDDETGKAEGPLGDDIDVDDVEADDSQVPDEVLHREEFVNGDAHRG